MKMSNRITPPPIAIHTHPSIPPLPLPLPDIHCDADGDEEGDEEGDGD